MIDKRLALVFEFENSPESLKKAAEAHKQAYLDLLVSSKQADLWVQQKEKDRRMFDLTLRQYNQELDKWDPANIKDAKPVKLEALKVPKDGNSEQP